MITYKQQRNDLPLVNCKWTRTQPRVAGLKRILSYSHTFIVYSSHKPTKKINTQHFFIVVCIPRYTYTHYIYHFQGHWFTLISSNEKNNVFNLYTQRTSATTTETTTTFHECEVKSNVCVLSSIGSSFCIKMWFVRYLYMCCWVAVLILLTYTDVCVSV